MARDGADPTGCHVVVVVPTYNERDALPQLISSVRELSIPQLKILVVDDNSPDGTGQVADAIAAADPHSVAVLHRPAKDGLGRAYIAGMTRALDDGADVIVQMDADLSHPASALPDLIRAVGRPGCGLAIGSRYVAGGSVDDDWPLARRLLSRWANWYVNAILHLGIHDVTAGYKAWRAETVRDLDLPSLVSNGYSFQVELNHRAAAHGWGISEVPIRFAERTHGASKMSLAVQLESALTPWRLRAQRRKARV
jgi:dolichol-phosphate mannosyltransferase